VIRSIIPPLRDANAQTDRKGIIMPRQGVRAKLPDKLPGRFFVLTYYRSTGQFSIFLDDRDHTSYRLGADLPTVQMRFAVWGLRQIGNEAIDRAKEFGSAQAILRDGRIISLFDRTIRGSTQSPFTIEPEGTYVQLPSEARSDL